VTDLERFAVAVAEVVVVEIDRPAP